jgi:hypothetical protein
MMPASLSTLYGLTPPRRPTKELGIPNALRPRVRLAHAAGLGLQTSASFSPGVVEDVIIGSGPEKDRHPWQQAE